ncbi:MAG: hypothetical protein HYY17_07775 [Planctomycetes bacterium]|nr:hypothetical protein [Planctomycetota bacterium]
MSTLRAFAESRRLKLRRDEDWTEIVRGKRGQVYDYGDGHSLAVLLSLPTARHWTLARRRLLAAALTSRQNGDTEGTLTFNPADEGQVNAALREAKIKTRRVASPAQAEALRKARMALDRKGGRA